MARADGSLDEYDEFLALASHELKTPTATLLATAQLLRRQLAQQGTLEPDQLRRGVERLTEQSERLALLVKNLLDAARINAGRLSLQPEMSGLGIGLFVTRYIVESHGGTITADSPPGGGARFTIVLPTSSGTTAAITRSAGECREPFC